MSWPTSRHPRGFRRVLCLSQLHWPAVLRRLRPRSERAPHHHWLALQDLRHDRMAAWVCPGASADHQRDAEAAKPMHVQPNLDRAENRPAVTALTGSQDCVREMLAGDLFLRDQVVEGLRSHTGAYLRVAQWRFLRLSQREPLFRTRRIVLGVRCRAQIAARSTCSCRSGRRLRHARPHPRVVRGFVREPVARFGPHAQVLRRLVTAFHVRTLSIPADPHLRRAAVGRPRSAAHLR